MPNLKQESDPMAFWESWVKEYPNLASLARTYLAPPASSTASEREFKVGKGFQTQTRFRFLPNNLETLVFLKYNLRALNFSTNLENPPEGFVVPNSVKYDESEEEDSSSSGEEEEEFEGWL